MNFPTKIHSVIKKRYVLLKPFTLINLVFGHCTHVYIEGTKVKVMSLNIVRKFSFWNFDQMIVIGCACVNNQPFWFST